MVKKIFLSFLFSLLFTFFLLLTSVKFLFLNSDFLFASLARHKVYAEIPRFLEVALNQQNLKLEPEERQAYAAIAKRVTPELMQRTTEENISQILNFLHGRSTNLQIYLPTGELGLETADFYWSADNLQNPQMQNLLKNLYASTNYLVLACLVLGVIVLGLFVYLKSPGILLTTGSLVLVIGLVGRVFILVLVQTLPQETEPSAILLALIGNSILADALLVWIVLGGLLLSGGIVWKLARRLKR
jgi:hypothetical protein